MLIYKKSIYTYLPLLQAIQGHAFQYEKYVDGADRSCMLVPIHLLPLYSYVIMPPETPILFLFSCSICTRCCSYMHNSLA